MAEIKPDKLLDEHLEFLDELRDSGVTNMFGARPYLHRAYPDLSLTECGTILSYWMHTYGERRKSNA